METLENFPQLWGKRVDNSPLGCERIAERNVHSLGKTCVLTREVWIICGNCGKVPEELGKILGEKQDFPKQVVET